jgi:hypothetical protein
VIAVQIAFKIGRCFHIVDGARSPFRTCRLIEKFTMIDLNALAGNHYKLE